MQCCICEAIKCVHTYEYYIENHCVTIHCIAKTHIVDLVPQWVKTNKNAKKPIIKHTHAKKKTDVLLTFDQHC